MIPSLNTIFSGTKTQRTFTAFEALNSGGQGQIYLVSDGQAQYALKWYFEEQATDRQFLALETLMRHVQKDAELQQSNHFIWPQEVVTSDNFPGFGYVMQLLDLTEFKSTKSYVNMQVSGVPLRIRHKVAYELVSAFSDLNLGGLVYADINLDNVHFNPRNGEIKIIDNDNVVPIGKSGGVLGTPGFQAPELVTGRVKKPNLNTDLHSLAVYLFYLLFQGHPLLGRRELDYHIHDHVFAKRIYGTNPIFIHHPTNTENRPLENYHPGPVKIWEIYPWFIKDLFITSFTDGLTSPKERPRANTWKRSLKSLDDVIMKCHHCRNETFFHADKHKQGTIARCWFCREPVQPPLFRMEPSQKSSAEKETVILHLGTKLFPHQINQRTFDFSEPVAEVVSNPKKPSMWGLRNLTEAPWQVTTRTGQVKVVEPQKAVVLSTADTINFPQFQAKVKHAQER